MSDAFADRHIGLRSEDEGKMLAALGYGTAGELLRAAVPASIHMTRALAVPGPLTEAEALAERVASGNEFEVVAAEAGLTVAKTKPINRFETAAANTPSPALASKLFQIVVGEVTTSPAAEGHLVAKLIEVVAADPDSDPDAVAAVRESLVDTLQSDLLEQFLATMRGEYGVEINDQALAELLASF